MKQVFLVKERKENMPSGFVVPRHPEYVFIRDLGHNSWNARNKKTREIVEVKREIKGNFVEYEIILIQ